MTEERIHRPERIVVEVAISKFTGHLLMMVTATESDGMSRSVLYANEIQELVFDLGRADLLVLTPDGRSERRKRDE